MKDRTTLQTLLIIMISIAAAGLMVVSISQGWEFWIPPVLFLGSLAIWVIHLKQHMEMQLREGIYLTYAMLELFFYGIHETGFTNLSVLAILLLITFSLLETPGFLNLILIEYLILMLMQLALVLRHGTMVFDSLKIVTLLLQIVAVICAALVFRFLTVAQHK